MAEDKVYNIFHEIKVTFNFLMLLLFVCHMKEVIKNSIIMINDVL